MLPKGIRYISLYEKSGYGESAKRYLQGLMRLGIPLTWSPMVRGSGLRLGYEPFEGKSIGDPEFDQIVNATIEYDTVIVHTVPAYYPYWAERERGKALFGYTAWETTSLPQHWPQLLNLMDCILVPCTWNKLVFESAGLHCPVRVVPHCLSATQASPPIGISRVPIPEIDENTFVFYSINTWTTRKRMGDLVRAYLNAFTADDATVLLLKTSPHSYLRSSNRAVAAWQQIRKPRVETLVTRTALEYPNPARIILLTEELDEFGIQALHERGDCYVSLSYGEGWGIGAFDACAAATPVIMTGFGGQRDYLTENDSYVCPFELVPVRDPAGGISYTAEQQWGEADISAASKLLRETFERRADAQSRGMRSQQRVRAEFSNAKVTEQLIQTVKEIAPSINRSIQL